MPRVELPQAEFKVVVVGDSHIGKTSLVTRFAEGYYRENSRPATVGGYFVTKTIQSSDNVITKIQIWDTAGAESFRAMAPMFYKTASAIIICYDATRRDTFDGMRTWLDEVRRRVRVGQDVVVAIAALKTDLLKLNDNDGIRGGGVVAKVAVPDYEVEQLAEALGFIYFPTSAKTGLNIHALFQSVADRVLQYRLANPRLNGDVDNDGNRKRFRVDGANRAKISEGRNNHHSDCNGSNAGSTMNHGLSPCITPRKGDRFISTNNEVNDTWNQNETMNGKASSIALEKFRGSSSRSGTPSTTSGTITADFEGLGGEDPLFAHATPIDKTKRGDESKLPCATNEYACSPTACGAIGSDGSSCIVQ
jgi:Ras-related protein Rab-5C